MHPKVESTTAAEKSRAPSGPTSAVAADSPTRGLAAIPSMPSVRRYTTLTRM